ncbi:MAG: ABC-type lipoprotein release transport system permease subunit [Candidatus Azotimanducaceae bacterium]
MSLLFKLAFRNIFRQRRRSLLTALSIGGGYLLCALSFSLVEGSYNNLINLFTLTKTGHVQIHKGDYLDRPKLHKAIDDYQDIGQQLEGRGDVKSYTYRIFAPALAYSNDGNHPARVIGIDLARERATTLIADKVTTGHYIDNKADSDGYFQAMVGMGVAESLEVGLGDELILISQGADGSIANDIFKVGAIIGSRDSGDGANVYLPLNAAQSFLALEGRVHEIVVTLDNYDESEAFAKSYSKNFAETLPDVAFSNLTVSPWQEVEVDFYKSMESDKRGNTVALGIILFIVFIGVLNTVLMSVLERTREFGVMKAIGSSPVTILSLVTIETTVLATLSVAASLFLTLPLTYWLTHVGFELSEPIDVGGIMFSAYRGEMSWFVLGLPFLLLIFFAFIISIPPGIRAARISPTQAMRSF